jgi:hypothetical protein
MYVHAKNSTSDELMAVEICNNYTYFFMMPYSIIAGGPCSRQAFGWRQTSTESHIEP